MIKINRTTACRGLPFSRTSSTIAHIAKAKARTTKAIINPSSTEGISGFMLSISILDLLQFRIHFRKQFEPVLS